MTIGIRVLLAVALLTVTGSVCAAQAGDSAKQPANFKVQIWGTAEGEFARLVRAYSDLRARLQVGAPVLSLTDNPAEIYVAESILAGRIRSARAGAKRGDIFTRQIGAAFKKVLRAEMNEGIWWAIMDDNPKEFEHVINGVYPKTLAVSTMPPSILAQLPALPPGIEYRFLGRHLILRDMAANIIVDRLSHAIECHKCPNLTR